MNIAQIETMARDLVDADTTSLPAATLLIYENAAYEDIVGKLIALDTNWLFGDSNFTANPTGLVTMVNSQEAYQLAGNVTSTGVSTATPLLTFLGASIKDNSGNWKTLEHISLWDLFDQGIDPVEHFKTDGQPRYYELREDFIILYPAPDNGVTVTLTSGLKVFYQRGGDLFTSGQVTTGTKVPGFASPFHPLIAYKAVLPYAQKYKQDRVPAFTNEINRLEKEMINFYTKRDKTDQPQITIAPIMHR